MAAVADALKSLTEIVGKYGAARQKESGADVSSVGALFKGITTGFQRKDEKGKAIERSSAGGGAAAALQGLGDAATMIGSMFGTVGTAVGMVVSGFAKLDAAVITSVETLRNFARGLHEDNIKFKEMSPGMAQVGARQEVRDFLLGRSKGQARAASSENLAEAISKLDRQLAPLENWWAEFKNDIMTDVIKLLTSIASTVNEWFGSTKKGDQEMDLGLMEAILNEAEIDDRVKETRPGRLAKASPAAKEDKESVLSKGTKTAARGLNIASGIARAIALARTAGS